MGSAGHVVRKAVRPTVGHLEREFVVEIDKNTAAAGIGAT
jgi:hypothetical protein